MVAGYRATAKSTLPKHWRPPAKHTHVALDDAIKQGERFMNIVRELNVQRGDVALPADQRHAARTDRRQRRRQERLRRRVDSHSTIEPQQEHVMTPEQLFAIIGASVGSILIVGLTLAGLLLHLAGRITRVEDRQIGQGERLARLEGKLDRFDPPHHDPAPRHWRLTGPTARTASGRSERATPGTGLRVVVATMSRRRPRYLPHWLDARPVAVHGWACPDSVDG